MIEEYDKLDCAARGMVRELLDHPYEPRLAGAADAKGDAHSEGLGRWACTFTCACIQARPCVCLHVNTVCMHVCMYVCMRVCILLVHVHCVCVCVCEREGGGWGREGGRGVREHMSMAA